MARKVMVQREDGSSPVLTEIMAENEAQLQETVKDNPDLLPVDEFGMTGPLMVVGRETALPSGALDLLCATRGGDLLIVEFKTGPQNSDFRSVLAQSLDYGSDLWQMSYEEFESEVAKHYFASGHCQDARLRGNTALEEAARAFWEDISEEEVVGFRAHLAQQLKSGAFHYVLVAQRFTPTMERTVEYLNAAMSEARFYAVELVRFAGIDLSAFEARTTLKPEPLTSGTGARQNIDEEQFLEQVEDEAYREALRELFEVCGHLGLLLPWGPAGTSIRLRIPGRTRPLSVGWVFPPGVSGWMGLTDLTMGLDFDQVTSMGPALESYLEKIGELPGARSARPDWLSGYHLSPEVVVENRHRIAEILTELVQQVSEG